MLGELKLLKLIKSALSEHSYAYNLQQQLSAWCLPKMCEHQACALDLPAPAQGCTLSS